MAVGAAIAAAAVVGAVAASKQGKAAQKAGEAQAAAGREAAELSHEQFLMTREDLAPWRAGGEQALYMLQDLYGVPREIRSPQSQAASQQAQQIAQQAAGGALPSDPSAGVDPRVRELQNLVSLGYVEAGEPGLTALQYNRDIAGGGYAPLTAAPQQQAAPQEQVQTQMTPRGTFETSPGYLFRQQEGMDAIQKSAAARGLLRSGGTLQAIQQYGQGLASEEFGRYTNVLQSLAGVGQTATAQTGAFGAQAVGQQSQALQAAAAGRASGYLGQGQAYGQAAQGIQQGLGLYAGLQYGQGYGASSGAAPAGYLGAGTLGGM